MLTSATPAKAFLIGAGVITVSVKAWVFTFAAIGVIGDANLSRPANIGSYVVFVALAASVNLLIVGVAAIFPQRSSGPLDRVLRWLQSHDRALVIGVGLIFGVWFGIKALRGFGIV